ncbi:transposase [Bradyrhizobium tropiciagri]|uniref:integrase core domain-containing protein n=1 Tax=Bradyrhizobium tropiciagri TaxID=312253 RepID=UPI001BA7EB09|nr:transposase [Bradyrhizobium tropiciagri]
MSRRLNESLFVDFNEARQIIEEWRIAHNTNRPHRSLNGSHRPSLQPGTTGAKPRADDPGFCWYPLGLNGCAARKIFNRAAVSRRP